jgi:hypothetical protein
MYIHRLSFNCVLADKPQPITNVQGARAQGEAQGMTNYITLHVYFSLMW